MERTSSGWLTRRSFGLIGGTGIVFALLAMLLVLPALLTLAERLGLLNLTTRGEASVYEPDARFPFARTILTVCLVIIGVAFVVAEPKGLSTGLVAMRARDSD